MAVKIKMETVVLFLVAFIFIITLGLLCGLDVISFKFILFSTINSIAAVSFNAFYAKKGIFTIEDNVQRSLMDMMKGGVTGIFGLDLSQSVIRTITKTSHFIGNLLESLRDTTDNVMLASEEVAGKTKTLIQDAESQAISVKEASQSIMDVDHEIENVVGGMDILSGFIDQTSSSVMQMTSSVEEVVDATHILASFVDEISASIEEMARSIGEVASNADTLSSFAIENSSAMTQMDATITQIEENVRQMEGLIQEGSSLAIEGQKIVQETGAGLARIKQSVMTNMEVIHSLGRSSKEIGAILKLIKDIADQTNLLSLNAAIIAAQAGEHGKAFGVVAEEIRDLSERTSQATTEVSGIIQSIQKEVDHAVKEASSGVTLVDEGVELGRRSSESLSSITEAMEASQSSMSHIVRAASEQSKGSKQVTSASEEMTKMIERISNATREQAQTSQIIADKITTMRELTQNVDKAMDEQGRGSKLISEGMEQVKTSVDSIQKSLLRMSQAGRTMVEAIEVINAASIQTLGGARGLSNAATAWKQESLILTQELKQFTLPVPIRGGELKIGGVSYEYNLDPIHAQTIRDGELVHPYSEGLVKFGFGTRILPGAAKSWDISSDGLRYTFHINPDARFHNGRRVTASDFIFSLERLLSPKTESQGRWVAMIIEGAQDFSESKSNKIRGLKAHDDATLEILLNEPIAFFIYLLTMPEMKIIPSEATDSKTLKLIRPISCGPYRVKDAAEKGVLFDRFNDYHNKETAFVDKISFDLTSNGQEDLLTRMKRGDYNYCIGMSEDMVASFMDDPKWEANIQRTVLLNTTFLGMKMDTPPFDNKLVRQAFNYAMNREKMLEFYKGAKPAIAKGVLPPGIVAYNSDLIGYRYDPDRSKFLLKKAGFESGFPLDIFISRTSMERSKYLPIAFENLREIGIRLTVTVIEHKDFEAKKKAVGRPALFSSGWYADYPDPDSFLMVLFHSKSGDILEFHYKNPEFDRIVDKARICMDLEERIKLYRKAEMIVVEDAPCIFLFHDLGFVVHTPNLLGMRLYLTPPLVRPETIWFKSSNGNF